jgi:hypothetical protein
MFVRNLEACIADVHRGEVWHRSEYKASGIILDIGALHSSKFFLKVTFDKRWARL